MIEWLVASWHKILIAFIATDHLIRRLVEFEDDYKRTCLFLERRIKDRRKKMTNPIADIQLALTILAQLRTALPTLAKGLQDLKQAWADKSDSTKVANDLVQWLNDNEPLLNQILALVPPAAAPIAPAAPTSTTPAA